MVNPTNSEPHWTTRFWRGLRARLKGPWIARVPNELAQCEFNCRHAECDFERWMTCENRINTSQRLDAWDERQAAVRQAAEELAAARQAARTESSDANGLNSVRNTE